MLQRVTETLPSLGIQISWMTADHYVRMLSTVCFVIPLFSSIWCSWPIPKTRRRHTILRTEFLVFCGCDKRGYAARQTAYVSLCTRVKFDRSEPWWCRARVWIVKINSTLPQPRHYTHMSTHTPAVFGERASGIDLVMSKNLSRTSWSFKMEATRCAETPVTNCDATEDLRRSKTWNYLALDSAQWRTVVNATFSARVS